MSKENCSTHFRGEENKCNKFQQLAESSKVKIHILDLFARSIVITSPRRIYMFTFKTSLD